MEELTTELKQTSRPVYEPNGTEYKAICKGCGATIVQIVEDRKEYANVYFSYWSQPIHPEGDCTQYRIAKLEEQVEQLHQALGKLIVRDQNF